MEIETEPPVELTENPEEASGFSLWPIFFVIAFLMIGFATWNVLAMNAERDAQARAVAKARAEVLTAAP